MKIFFVFLMVFLVFIGCENSVGPDPPTDTTPPQVESVFPEDGARSVSVHCSVEVTFSEPIQPTLQMTLQHGITAVAGNLTVSEQKAVFTPSRLLLYGTIYRVTVSGVRDKAGNLMPEHTWSFTTEAAPDTIPPQVTSSQPADGATGVAPDVEIRVVFSEAVNVPSGAFILQDESKNSIPGTSALSGSTFTFTPQNDLAYNTTYTAIITTAVTDLAGNHLQQDYSFSFTIKPDDVPPQVVETFPADGDTGVAKDTDIWVKFSEPIDPASVNANTFSVSGLNGNISGNYFVNNDTARFVPDSLSWQTTYTVTLAGITDLAGNPMATYTFSFTTQPDTIVRWILINGGMKRLDITNDGTVYSLGGSQALNAPVVVKYNSQGEIVWIKPLPNYVGYNRDIAVYSGNGYDEIYVLTARPYGMGGPGNVTKLDADGNILWTSQDFSFLPISIKTSDDGRVFAVGSGAVYEFDRGNGDIIYILNIGTNNTGIYDVVAFSDYIYVSGETYENLFAPTVHGDWFVAKYDANYNLIWGVQFNGPDSVAEYKGKLAVDRNANMIYVGGGYGIAMSWVKDGIAAYVDNGNSADFLWFRTVTNNISLALADLYTKVDTYNSSVYYGNSAPNTPVKVLSDGTVSWNLSSNGVSDFDFYDGKMYVLFPYPLSNKIYIFDADVGIPLN